MKKSAVRGLQNLPFWPKTTVNISADTDSYVTRIAKYFTKRFPATTAVTSRPDTTI